jgi:outer membrane protein OmpA-like peptidoglycan-associated protein
MKTNKVLGVAVLTAMLSGCMTHQHAVYFDTGSSKLTKASKEVLMGAAKETNCPWKEVTLTGFTDKTGGKMSNIKLSDKRVASVNTELMNLGIKPKKINTVASSMSSIDKTNKNLSQARRVEIIIK